MSTISQHAATSPVAAAEYAVEVRASGDFTLSRELLESVGASLAVAQPILSANLAAGTVDLRAAVRAPSRSAARKLAACALRDAMVAAGCSEVELTPRGWLRAIRRSAR